MWLRRPTITPISVVKEHLVPGRLEPAFLTPTRLSKLSKTQRDVVLALARRIREVAILDTLKVKLPRLKYLQNIVNYLIDNLKIDNEANTEQVKQVIGKIPENIIQKFISSEAVNSQKKILYFGELFDLIIANIRDMMPRAEDAAPKT